jgi:hypothetical protein
VGNNILDSGLTKWDDLPKGAVNNNCAVSPEGEGSINSQLLSLFSGDGRRCVVVLQAFFDESGTHKGASRLSVAACFADHAAWSGFQLKWRKFMSDNRVSRFHAKDADDFLKLHLAYLIKKYRIYSAVCSVSPELFKNHAKIHFRSTIGNAYSSCAYGCALAIARHAMKHRLGPVAMVLEWGQPNVDKVKKTLEELIGDAEFAIASVAIAKKEDFTQLHVPDFISHICSTGDPWFKALMDSGGIIHAPFNKKLLENTSRDVSKLIEKNKAERRRIRRTERE